MKNTLLLSLALVAGCHSSKHADGVACDAKAVKALAGSLDQANGIGLDLQDAKVKTDIAAATKELTGKTYAFTGCKFSSQGNDVVSFSASDGDKSVDCHMKGGEEGVTKFRHAAMAVGQDKLKLDVSGVIAPDGDAHFPRLAMTACEIDAHE
jgi:hypothetical protein